MTRSKRPKEHVEYDMAFSKRLRKAVDGAGISFKELSDWSGINYNAVLGYANNHVAPCAYHVVKICEVLRIDPVELIGKVGFDDRYTGEADRARAKAEDEVGPRLLDAMGKSGLDEREVARRSGIQLETLREYAYGERHPGTGDVVALCTVLGSDAGWLLGLEDRC